MLSLYNSGLDDIATRIPTLGNNPNTDAQISIDYTARTLFQKCTIWGCLVPLDVETGTGDV